MNRREAKRIALYLGSELIRQAVDVGGWCLDTEDRDVYNSEEDAEKIERELKDLADKLENRRWKLEKSK